MRGNQRFKKTAALVLSGVMTLGAVPLSPLVHEAHAGTAAAAPSAVAYATKTELGAETPPLVEVEDDYTGDVTKVGRIKLGQDANGDVMEWYILGADSGGAAIFAASNIVN